MKIGQNWSFWFLWILVYPGHENRTKLKCLNFVKFGVPEIMKIGENWNIWFGHENWRKLKHLIWSWKLDKTEAFDFCEFLCNQGHKNWRKLKYSQKSNTCPIFMTPGTRNFTKIRHCPIFMTPSTQKFTKIKYFNFLQFSWPRVHETSLKSNASIFSNFHDPVHETSLKSNASIFSNFHDPWYTKLKKNQVLQFFPIFMTPGTWNFTKIKCLNFLQFSWPPGTWNFTKIKCFNFLQFSWPRVHETSLK